MLTRRGPGAIGVQLGVAPSTVGRVLARHHTPPLAACDPVTGQLIRASRLSAARYERAAPGDLVHVDVKKLGRIPDGGGWRALGRAATVDYRHKKVPVTHRPRQQPCGSVQLGGQDGEAEVGVHEQRHGDHEDAGARPRADPGPGDHGPSR